MVVVSNTKWYTMVVYCGEGVFEDECVIGGGVCVIVLEVEEVDLDHDIEVNDVVCV